MRMLKRNMHAKTYLAILLQITTSFHNSWNSLLPKPTSTFPFLLLHTQKLAGKCESQIHQHWACFGIKPSMHKCFSKGLPSHFWRNTHLCRVNFHNSGGNVQQIAMKKHCESLFALVFKCKLLLNNDLQKSKHDKRTLSLKCAF